MDPSEIILLDGGMGTMLQAAGLPIGQLPELWNVTRPEAVTAIHRRYVEAGSRVLYTNTFGANRCKAAGCGRSVRELVEGGVRCARAAAAGRDVKVALDIGPTGRLLEPLGDLGFEETCEIFREIVVSGAEAGADLIVVETMSDLNEMRAAVLAAKENSNLPVWATMTFEATGRSFLGVTVGAMALTLTGVGVDALGVNCSLGPKELLGLVRELREWTALPLILKPNAGLPDPATGEYHITPEEFAAELSQAPALGVSILGGCCGTTPEFIRAAAAALRDLRPAPRPKKTRCGVCSATTVAETNAVRVIGERINPTGKKRFQQALREGDIDYIVLRGVEQQDAGADILDVNVGLPGLDEPEMMRRTVRALQAAVDLPLQIDTVRPEALEQALRIYNGKPLINSVNAKKNSMETVFPLMKKYGGAVIALTIGEDGIPETAEGRCALAKRIIDAAEKYGIDKKDIIVDPLCMAVSSGDLAGRVTLDSIRLIKALGVKTCLGVSNISFALPERAAVTAVFLAMALENGLDCAILNPCSDDMMRTLRTFVMLAGKDPHCENYLAFAEAHPRQSAAAPAAPAAPQAKDDLPELMYAIVKGLSARAAAAAKELLQHEDPLRVIETQIIPALNLVGERFEKGRLFLPQLLMSAESANAAFSLVAEKLPRTGGAKDRVILATVEGDIHDIGKNIVKVLLQSYGFEVVDLGKDVKPAQVLQAVLQYDVRLVGLSALMTTTLDSMRETVALLREKAPRVQTVVGGAVLTKDYADLIGATYYAKDAMQSVHFAKRVFGR